MILKFKICPICSSKNVVKTVYKLPQYKADIEYKAKIDDFIIQEGYPEYICKDCNYEWDKEQIIVEAYANIRSVKVSLGELSGPSYCLELDFVNNQILWHGAEGITQELVIKSMKKNEMNELIERLKMLNLLCWQPKYIGSCYLNGIRWKVDIEIGEKTFQKCGNNKYPKEWGKFYDLIKVLSAKTFL